MRNPRLSCLGPESCGIGDLPKTWISGVTYHYVPHHHRGYLGEPNIFQPTMWEPRGLPLGEIDVGQLVCSCSKCSPLKGVNSLGGPIIVVMLILRLH